MNKKTAVSKKAIIAELKRRQALQKEESEKPVFNFNEHCFEAQQKFFKSKGPRFRTAVCSRRAGKTVGIAADAIGTCLSEPNVICLYVTLTQQNARNIIWNDITKLLEDYQIEHKSNDVRLSITFPNGSKFICAGAKDRQEIEKYRGWKLRKCYIDECQSFRPYIKELINDVITPALRDLRGELYLTGTPGPVPAGPFYEYSHSDFWENHHWTAFDNPHMHSPESGLDLEETLREEREMKGIDEHDPGYQRETYGLWVEDVDSLVYKFNKNKNVYQDLPEEGEWTYIFGIDIGFEDADAIAVLAYNDQDKKVYLVQESVKKKQDISSLIEEIKRLKNIYNPAKMVIDAGALGKKVHEELRRRHGLPIQAAEKKRKVEFIELLNDDLRNKKLLAPSDSTFAEDCMLVQWDRESKIRNPERPKISTTYHSDICDAVLYGWRECHHYLSEKDKIAPKIGTDAYMDQMEQLEAEKIERRKQDPYWQIHEQHERDIEELQDILDSEDWL